MVGHQPLVRLQRTSCRASLGPSCSTHRKHLNRRWARHHISNANSRVGFIHDQSSSTSMSSCVKLTWVAFDV